MSLYNMVNGVNPAAFYFLPMLGDKHPDSYPRFRDCMITEDDGQNRITLLTRTGGGNRPDYESEIEELRNHPNFIRDHDADWDSTYAYFDFSVPEEFKGDFDIVMEGKLSEASKQYQERIRSVFPKLKEQFDNIWPQ
jgi:hypothetical protein